MITIVNTKRIAKILVNGKHKKSFPLSVSHCLGGITHEHISCFEKGLRLTDSDIKIVGDVIFPVLYKEFCHKLKDEEPYVFDLIKRGTHIGCREVFSREKNRFEMCFKNGTKIKVNEVLFKFSPKKLSNAYLNY